MSWVNSVLRQFLANGPISSSWTMSYGEMKGYQPLSRFSTRRLLSITGTSVTREEPTWRCRQFQLLHVKTQRCGKTFLWTAHDQESGLTCPPGIYVQEIPPGGYQQDTDLETTSGSTVKSFCYRSWWTQRMIRCYTVNLSSLSP